MQGCDEIIMVGGELRYDALSVGAEILLVI